MHLKYLITIILFTQSFMMSSQHAIPESIQYEATKALNYYPELKQSKITFKFKKNIKKSTMQARPTFGSLFRSKKQRRYIILISEKFKISDKEFLTQHIESDILIGWIGHELGHIMDYQNRSKLGLVLFGINYLFSDNHIVEAERAADMFAVAHGMENYILKTKDFYIE